MTDRIDVSISIEGIDLVEDSWSQTDIIDLSEDKSSLPRPGLDIMAWRHFVLCA
jgi:hypothetical protein